MSERPGFRTDCRHACHKRFDGQQPRKQQRCRRLSSRLEARSRKHGAAGVAQPARCGHVQRRRLRNGCQRQLEPRRHTEQRRRAAQRVSGQLSRGRAGQALQRAQQHRQLRLPTGKRRRVGSNRRCCHRHRLGEFARLPAIPRRSQLLQPPARKPTFCLSQLTDCEVLLAVPESLGRRLLQHSREQ